MVQKLSSLAILYVSTSALALTSPALAQDDGIIGLETILVTATKREQTLQEVPIAVSTFSAAELQVRNIQGFDDFIAAIPGVQYNYAGNPFSRAISIRGVADPSGGGLVQAPIAQYLDETPLTLSQGSFNLDYTAYNVDQISIIKGPHSTLYGAASLGGTIKVETRKPSLDQVRVGGKFIISDTKSGEVGYSIAASVSGPLVDGKLGAEVTGYHRKDGGFIDDPSRGTNDINSAETTGARLALRFKPTDPLTIDATVYYQDYMLDSIEQFAPTTAGDLNSRPLLFDQPADDEIVLGSLVIKYDFGSAELVSASSYFDREGSVIQDFTTSFFNFGTPGEVIDTSVDAFAKVFSQEIRLLSTGDGPLQWLVGGFYSNESYDEIAGFNNSNFGALFDGPLLYDYRTLAGFGEVSYEPIDGLTLTVGGRITNYKSDVDFELSGLFAPPAPLNTLVRTDKDTDFSPRGAINYEIPVGSVYAQVAKGFRLGQANVPIATTAVDNVPAFFGSDSLWNYEIGTKTNWFDNRLSVNVAIYYIDWSDIQQNIAASTGLTFIDNLGSAEIYGLELESRALLTDNTQFSLGIAFNNAELGDDVPGVAMAGQDIPGVPKWQITSSLQHDFQVAGNDAYARVDYLYYGEFDNDFVQGGAMNFVNGGYHKADIRIGVKVSEIFDVQIFANNLFDERPIINREFAAGEAVTTIRPRTIGASLSVNY